MKKSNTENILGYNNSEPDFSNNKLDETERILKQFPDELLLEDADENKLGFTQYLKDLLNQFDKQYKSID